MAGSPNSSEERKQQHKAPAAAPANHALSPFEKLRRCSFCSVFNLYGDCVQTGSSDGRTCAVRHAFLQKGKKLLGVSMHEQHNRRVSPAACAPYVRQHALEDQSCQITEMLTYMGAPIAVHLARIRGHGQSLWVDPRAVGFVGLPVVSPKMILSRTLFELAAQRLHWKLRAGTTWERDVLPVLWECLAFLQSRNMPMPLNSCPTFDDINFVGWLQLDPINDRHRFPMTVRRSDAEAFWHPLKLATAPLAGLTESTALSTTLTFSDSDSDTTPAPVAPFQVLAELLLQQCLEAIGNKTMTADRKVQRQARRQNKRDLARSEAEVDEDQASIHVRHKRRKECHKRRKECHQRRKECHQRR